MNLTGIITLPLALNAIHLATLLNHAQVQWKAHNHFDITFLNSNPILPCQECHLAHRHVVVSKRSLLRQPDRLACPSGIG